MTRWLDEEGGKGAPLSQAGYRDLTFSAEEVAQPDLSSKGFLIRIVPIYLDISRCFALQEVLAEAEQVQAWISFQAIAEGGHLEKGVFGILSRSIFVGYPNL